MCRSIHGLTSRPMWIGFGGRLILAYGNQYECPRDAYAVASTDDTIQCPVENVSGSADGAGQQKNRCRRHALRWRLKSFRTEELILKMHLNKRNTTEVGETLSSKRSSRPPLCVSGYRSNVTYRLSNNTRTQYLMCVRTKYFYPEGIYSKPFDSRNDLWYL